MSVRIHFHTDNDAFSDHPEQETARILRILAQKVESGGLPGKGGCYGAYDSNGNRVGSLISDHEEDQ